MYAAKYNQNIFVKIKNAGVSIRLALIFGRPKFRKKIMQSSRERFFLAYAAIWSKTRFLPLFESRFPILDIFGKIKMSKIRIGQ